MRDIQADEYLNAYSNTIKHSDGSHSVTELSDKLDLTGIEEWSQED